MDCAGIILRGDGIEILCVLPTFFIFVVVAIYAQSHSRPDQSREWTDEDSLTMEDIILLDMLDDDDHR